MGCDIFTKRVIQIKLKVSTRSNDSVRKQQKIMDCLRTHPEGTTPKTIARETGLNINTVKSILPLLRNIKKAMRGFYKVVERGDDTIPSPSAKLTDWNFHNCILTYESKCPPVIQLQNEMHFGLINVHFNLSTKGKATLRISSDYPLNVSSLSLAYGFFAKEIEARTGEHPLPMEIYISSIEFNKDYSNLRLDGLSSISLDSLAEQFKAYQKQHGLRIEHKTKVPFTVENIIDLLSSNPNALDIQMKLSTQKEHLERLTAATQRNTEMLFRIIDEVKSK